MNDNAVRVNYKIQFTEKLKKEKVFIIALILAVCSSMAKMPKLSYINFKVLVLLFNLMVIVAAFKELKIMDILAVEILSKCRNTRRVSLVFVMLAFFSAMLVTNDVALLTFVPLTILTFKAAKVDCMKTVIIETLAANIGSSLTPMGNPQNLFLFTHYNLSAVQFFYITIPFVFSGMLWLIYLNKRIHNRAIKITLQKVHIEDLKGTLIYSALFMAVIASVFGIISYKYTLAAVIICILILNKKLFIQVDYFLLLTFICFFVFIGNLSNFDAIQLFLKGLLKSRTMTYFASILASQIISNVPCSILLAGFTDNWKEVLLGVNIGGMGTLIASLASLISYKIYMNEIIGSGKEYLKKFSIYNFVSLVLFTAAIYLICIL